MNTHQNLFFDLPSSCSNLNLNSACNSTSNSHSHTPISSASLGINTRHRSGTLPSYLSSSGTNVGALTGTTSTTSKNNNANTSSTHSNNIQPNISTNNNHLTTPPSVLPNTLWDEGLAIGSNGDSIQSQNPPRLRSYSNNSVDVNLLNQQNQSSQLNQLSSFSTIDEDYFQNVTPASNPSPAISSNPRQRSQTYAAPVNNLNNMKSLQMVLQQQQQQQQHQNQFQFQPQLTSSTPHQMTRASSFSLGSAPTLQLQQVNTVLQDNIPENLISLTSSHTNPLLGPTNTLLFIHIPNDPLISNSNNFYKILKQFGNLSSVRSVICNDTSDIVIVAEFLDLESSINCKSTLNNYELYPGLKCSILFAKILELSSSSIPPSTTKTAINNAQQSHQKSSLDLLNFQVNSLNQSNLNLNSNLNSLNQSSSNLNSNLNLNLQIPSIICSNSNHNSKSVSNIDDLLPFKITSLNDKINSFKKINDYLFLNNEGLLNEKQLKNFSNLLKHSINYDKIKSSDLGPLPPSLSHKNFDNPSLREIRKQLDQNLLTNLQIEELALTMDMELPELASDYLGNTIVQKFLEVSSPIIREDIIKKLVPYLSQMSAHKNGTWAAQKLINTIKSNREMKLVSESLKPFTTQLFNDTYANYVIHGVLKFNSPYSNFIFESLLSTFLTISFNRFGVRAARTCLETVETDDSIIQNIGKESIVLIIIAILTWCWELMSDVNGSLLITWFLETCQTLENKHYLLSYILTNEDKFTDEEEAGKKGKREGNQTEKNVEQEKEEEKGVNGAEGKVGINEPIESLSDYNKILINSSKFIKLCTLKLGALSVLKVLNYRTDLSARNLILRKIFGDDIFNDDLNFEDKKQCTNDELILKAILLDLSASCNDLSAHTTGSNNTNITTTNTSSNLPVGCSQGANFIHKILSIPTLDPILKKNIIHKIKLVLTDIINEYGMSVSNNSLRRLSEECGIRGFCNTQTGHGNGGQLHHNRSISNCGNNSLSNLSAWKSRSRSNSNATTGEQSPPIFVSQQQQHNQNIDYELLLRRQLEELSLSSNSGMNAMNGMNNMNMINGINNMNSVSNMNMNNLKNINGINGINDMSNINGMNLNNINHNGMNLNMNNINGMNNMSSMSNVANLNNISNMGSMNSMNNMNNTNNMNGLNGINNINMNGMNNINMNMNGMNGMNGMNKINTNNVNGINGLSFNSMNMNI